MNRLRVGRRGIVVLVAALLVLSVVPGGVAAEERVGGTVVVPAGETVDGLSVVAGSVVVRGTVDGNLEGVGGSIVIAESGVVTGDVSASAGSLRIDGTVAGDVEGAGGSVTIGETGVVEGSLDVGAGSVLIDGAVRGDVTAGAETLELGSTAVVGGDLTVDRETDLVVSDGAQVEGTLVRADLGGIGPAPFADLDPLLTAWGFAANLLLGAVLLLAFPRFSDRVADYVGDDPALTGGWGLGVLVGGAGVMAVLVLSVVGIPLALVVGVPVIVVGGWVALVYGRYAVAAWALAQMGYENRWAALVAGIVGLGLVGLVPVLGGFVDIVVFALGLGALARALYLLREGREEETPPERGAAAAEDEGSHSPGPV